jgi:hypothetical protein
MYLELLILGNHGSGSFCAAGLGSVSTFAALKKWKLH